MADLVNPTGPTTRRMASQNSLTSSQPPSNEIVSNTSTITHVTDVSGIPRNRETIENKFESTPSNRVSSVNNSSSPFRAPSLPNLSTLSSIYDSHRKSVPAYKSLSSNSSNDTFSSLTSKTFGSNKIIQTDLDKDTSITPNGYENALCHSLGDLTLDKGNQMKNSSDSRQIKLFDSAISNSSNLTKWENQRNDLTDLQQFNLFETLANSNSNSNFNSNSSTTIPGFEVKLDQILAFSAKSSGESNYLMNKICVLESRVDREFLKLSNKIKEINERITDEISTFSQQIDSAVEFMGT